MFCDLDFLKQLWLFPVAVFVHEIEEWNIFSWYQKNNVELPSGTTKVSTRINLLLVSFVFFVWTGMSILTNNPKVAAILILPAIAAVFLNGLQHVYWLFIFKKNFPGAVSAILLLLPVSVYITWHALERNYLPLWYLLLVAVPVLFGIIETVKAKRSLPSSMTWLIQKLHHVGRLIMRG